MATDDRFRVTFRPAPEGLSDLLRLRKRLWATEGWTIGKDMKDLHRTWNVYRANWTHLNTLIGPVNADPAFAMDIGGTSRSQPQLAGFLSALDTALHNFTASAAILTDHLRPADQARPDANQSRGGEGQGSVSRHAGGAEA